MNSMRLTSAMSCISRPVNATGMALRPIRRWGISRLPLSAVKPPTDRSRCSRRSPMRRSRKLFVRQFGNPLADGFQLADGFLAKQHRDKGADRRYERKRTKEYRGRAGIGGQHEGRDHA